LEHGQWLPWLAKHWHKHDNTAGNYMAAARAVAKFPRLVNLKVRCEALYLLGAWLDNPDQGLCDAILAEAEQQDSLWMNSSRLYEIVFERRRKQEEEQEAARKAKEKPETKEEKKARLAREKRAAAEQQIEAAKEAVAARKAAAQAAEFPQVCASDLSCK
jgi:hypothetical protein